MAYTTRGFDPGTGLWAENESATIADAGRFAMVLRHTGYVSVAITGQADDPTTESWFSPNHRPCPDQVTEQHNTRDSSAFGTTLSVNDNRRTDK